MLRPVAALPLALLVAIAGCADPAATGADYLGEPPPGRRSVVFAPGRVSTALTQRDTAISPDGNLFLYTIWGEGQGTIVFFERESGRWNGPEVAPFSGLHNDLEPFLHPAGHRLYFASRRPLPGESEPGDWNLWSVDRREGGWAEPQPLDDVNQDEDEYFPAVTTDGTLYFTADREGSVGGEDIFVAAPTDGGFEPARSLGSSVNSAGPDFNAFVSADGSLLVFSSLRDGGPGGGDVYVSTKAEDGSWSPARVLGPEVNSTALDYCPFVTPDGRFMFFTSTRVAQRAPERRSFDELMHDLGAPENGRGSLYWVDASVLR